MPDENSPDLNDLRFLVIEDDPLAQTLAVELLNQMGAARVDVADDGLEALNLLLIGDRPADVLLVDLGMPDMGGAEMLRHLGRRKYAGSVILVSGADEETLTIAQEMAKTHGLDLLGFITKPITRDALAEALSRRA